MFGWLFERLGAHAHAQGLDRVGFSALDGGVFVDSERAAHWLVVLAGLNRFGLPAQSMA